MEPAIELAPGAEDHGFAPMLATLLRQNLDDHADKRATALRMRGRVAMVITDLGMSVTLEFVPYAVRVHAGIVGIPDVTVRAGSEYIMKMSMLELGRFGLPNPRGEVAKELAAAEKAGAITYYGALANIPLMLRLTRVMSVNA